MKAYFNIRNNRFQYIQNYCVRIRVVHNNHNILTRTEKIRKRNTILSAINKSDCIVYLEPNCRNRREYTFIGSGDISTFPNMNQSGKVIVISKIMIFDNSASYSGYLVEKSVVEAAIRADLIDTILESI